MAMVASSILGLPASADPLPAFPSPAAPVQQVAQLQRFLALATQPTGNEPPIRVLFYGQSIVDQWWSRFAQAVRARYPTRPWIFENRSLGGHTARFLLKTAEADVYPFQPDLLVFHDYEEPGSRYASYGEFVDRVRQRTCADILMVGNHVAAWDDLEETTKTNGLPVELWPEGAAVNYAYLPAIAQRVGACWADVRTPWREYLSHHRLASMALRVDGVHLNDAGLEFMTRLLARYVEPRVFVPPVLPYTNERVSRVSLPGRSEIEVLGNRLLLAARASGGPARVRCWVDHQLPSSRRELFVHDRASPWEAMYFPALLKIASVTLPVAEHWTLTVTQILGPRALAFQVVGSITGEDGEGRSDQEFTSRSGRVRILSPDWYWEAPGFGGEVQPGFQVQWTTRFLGADEVVSPAAGWRWIELANGLEDGPHTLRLELIEGDWESFPELLVYHPAGNEPGSGPDGTLRCLRGEDSVLVRWPADARWTAATTADWCSWQELAGSPAQFGRRQAAMTSTEAKRFFTLRPTEIRRE